MLKYEVENTISAGSILIVLFGPAEEIAALPIYIADYAEVSVKFSLLLKQRLVLLE
jgi:hypothetical protein